MVNIPYTVATYTPFYHVLFLKSTQIYVENDVISKEPNYQKQYAGLEIICIYVICINSVI